MERKDDKILEKVRTFAKRENLFGSPCAHVAAAVSGGADSMALLRILLALREEFGFSLSVCHVNHGLRGEAADEDEAFVRAECARLGVPVQVFRAAERGPIPSHAGEEWARRLRYDCFAQTVKELGGGITRLATAHTATDQAETLLFRLARGTGLHGAAGIRPLRGDYVRPLLCLTRAETEAYCRSLGQLWVTDATNDADDYARNRLRHAALPALRSANAAAERNLARFCEKAATADAYLTRQADGLLKEARADGASAEKLPAGARYARAAGQPVWRLEALRAADALILQTALHALVAPVRDAEEVYVSRLEALVQQGAGAVQVTGRVRFCARGGWFWREEFTSNPEPNLWRACTVSLADGAEYPLPGGKTLKIEVRPAFFEKKTRDVHKKDLKNLADYAKITTFYSALVLRSRQPGDHYRPAGRGVNKELRKWMGEAGIPPAQRAALPVLACGSEVVWVSGAGFADGLAPDESSARIVRLEEKTMEEKHHEHVKRYHESAGQRGAAESQGGAAGHADQPGL